MVGGQVRSTWTRRIPPSLPTTTPWASVEEALAVTNMEDFSLGAIHAFLDLEQEGVPGVETMDEA
jgi:hypothetical protein